MYNKKIKLIYLYLFTVFIIQMFFFGIYNIPIYKIYCELNNYYSVNNYNNYFQYKYYLYNLNCINYKENNIIYSIYLNNIDVKLKNISYNYFVDLSNLDFNNFSFITNIIYSNIYKLYNNTYFSDLDNIVYIIYFNTSVTNINILEFISLQNHVYIHTSETYLVFFRLYNPSTFFIKGISIYTINPTELNIYINKVQCFCFDEIVIYPFETIDLPILFYINNNINYYLNIESIYFFQLQIVYLFILNSFK